VQNKIFGIFQTALEQIFSETGIQVQSISPDDGKTFQDQVVTSIGIAGTVRGNFMLCTDYASANSIIRSMTGGVPVTFQSRGLGDLQKTALGEMANQISGRAVTILSEDGIECGITPPIIITAEKLQHHVPDLALSFSRVARGDFGFLRLFIALSTPVYPL
jgi:chemotaxis protein CheX